MTGTRGRTPAERFWAKVDKSAGPDGCWPREAGEMAKGYGFFKADGRCYPAHQWAYEQAYGPIPAGCEVDHVKARGCTRRDCVNPAHLEAVTHAENMRRAFSTGASRPEDRRPRATHCKRGHALTPENTKVMTSGGRACRTCWMARKREADQRRKERAA